MSNYATKKKLDYVTGGDTSDLAAKKDFDKLDINKLVNIPTSLNNLKPKEDDLNVSLDLKKLIDVIDNEVVKNTKFSTLKTKVNSLEKKFLMQLH